MLNVVLMAGHGKRFSDAGYKQSKPLIPVSGKPMILRAVESMPPADRWVFVVRQEHLDEQAVMDVLKSVAKDVTILVDPNPVGQLNSALVAREHYESSDEPLFIGACDFGMVYDHEAYAKIMGDGQPAFAKAPADSKLLAGRSAGKPDMLVWSFTKQPNLTRNPQAWGWLKLADDNHNDDNDIRVITGVSVKVPVSDNPFNDYAIEGSFSFASGKVFTKIAEGLIHRDIRVKNEFYIDSMIGVAIDMGYRVVSFPVRKYIGWGVPADYEEYVWWERAIAEPVKFLGANEKTEYAFWKDYFENDFRP